MSDAPPFRPFGKIESLRLLDSVLANNTAIYENGTRQDRRDAIANCLLSVASYLQENGIDLRHLKPITHVVETLTERENNRVDPIFCERARSGAPSRSLARDQQDGVISAIANYWLAHNADLTTPMRSRLNAAARQMQNRGLGSVSAARIKQARELVSQESVDHPARVMSETVTVWLQRVSKDFGETQAIGIILVALEKAPIFLTGDYPEN
jgi:hypothetical protein